MKRRLCKHKRNAKLFCSMTVAVFIVVFFIGCVTTIDLKAAQYIYIPRKIVTYSNIDDYGRVTNWRKAFADYYQLNKYGMETLHKTNSSDTTKYTFKKGLLKEVQYYRHNKRLAKVVYKYNKKKQVTSYYSYSGSGKLVGKALYTYKKDKLYNIKNYDKNILANTWTYKWKGKRLSSICKKYASKQTLRYKYTYKSGKVTKIEKTSSDGGNDIYLFNARGYLKRCTSKYSDGSISDDYVCTYKYDKNGNPKVVTRIHKNDNAPGAGKKIVYSKYKKCKVTDLDPIVLTAHLHWDREHKMKGLPTDYLYY